MTKSVDVDIKLPLPSDIATTIINLLGTAYPGAQIDVSGKRHFSQETMTIKIPEKERYKSPASRKKILKAKQHNESEHVANILSLREGMSAETPKEVSETFGMMAARIFLDTPEAENYLELQMQVTDPDDHRRYVVIVAKSEGQTPHELRKQAVDENARLRARIAELEEQA